MSIDLDTSTSLNLWYQFEDTTNSGTVMGQNIDTTGNYVVSLTNGAQLTTSEKKFGNKSLDLSSPGSYAIVPQTKIQNLWNFSVSMWFKTNKQTGYATIFSLGLNYTDALFFGLECTSNFITLRNSSNGSNYSKQLNDNQWHHVVAKFEKKDDAGYAWDTRGDINYYVDGVYFTTADRVTIFNGNEGANYQYIGRSNWDGTNNTLEGYIDDYRSYSYTLSDADVTALYERGVSHDIVCFLEGTQIACLDEETAE
jgi:hypothetical protein